MLKTEHKCLACKTGYYCLTNKRDRKNLPIYKCSDCGDEAI